MKAELGGLSGIVVAVTHITPSPAIGFVATHPAGSAGAVTPSKFSMHGGAADGLGEGGATVAVAVAVGVGDTPGVGVGVGTGVPPGVGVGDGTGVEVPPGVGVGTGVPLTSGRS